MCRGAVGIRRVRQSFLGIGDGVEQELDAFRTVGGFQFAAHVRKGVEKKLANIGLSESVAAVNLLASHQLEEIAEKEIDAGGRGEILEGTEEFGDSFVVLGALGLQAAEVVRAETFLGIGGEHAAAMAASVDVLAAASVRSLD